MMLLTVRIPDEVGASLESLAEATDRSKSYVAAKAIEDHVLREMQFAARVKEGLAAADRGEFATDEEVAAVFDKYRTPTKKKPRA